MGHPYSYRRDKCLLRSHKNRSLKNKLSRASQAMPYLTRWPYAGKKYGEGEKIKNPSRSECFQPAALRHHLCSPQSGHRAEAGPEANASAFPHCKWSRLCSQVPTELHSHGMLSLPLALETGTAIHLSKASPHSASSSVSMLVHLSLACL